MREISVGTSRPNGVMRTNRTTAPTAAQLTSRQTPCSSLTQPRSARGTAVARGPEPIRKRWRRSRVTPMSGARTMPNWGLTSAATTANPTAASEKPSIRKAMATSMTSAPTASIWPQSAESYQVTGLKR